LRIAKVKQTTTNGIDSTSYLVSIKHEKQLEEKDNLAKSYSCKTAIKAGDKLDERAMRLLIDQLVCYINALCLSARTTDCYQNFIRMNLIEDSAELKFNSCNDINFLIKQRKEIYA
ncbi:MAG: hypothetical protein MZV64_36910, partial [Ignavibacteriales bacterium]|nr:hypothetical protein [Ignavibacteriales bacterium]